MKVGLYNGDLLYGESLFLFGAKKVFAFLSTLVVAVVSTGAAVVSTAGSVVAGTVGLAGDIVGGVGTLLFGPQLTTGEQMAALAQPGFYDTAGAGILGGVTAAATQTVDYLGNLAPTALGIYQLVEPPKKQEPMDGKRVVPPIVIPPITTTRTVLPTLSQPQVMTVGAAAKPGAPNYLLYIGLAALALFLLRKK